MSKRILVVDDDLANRALFKSMLEHLGYHAETASTGLDALAILSPAIDLVLLDLMMLGMDGYEITRQIRSNPDLNDIPVIIVTSLTGHAVRLRALEAGANDLVYKPVEMGELKSCTESALSMSAAKK